MFEVCSEQLLKVPSQEVRFAVCIYFKRPYYDQLRRHHQPILQRDVDDLLFKFQSHENDHRFILDDIRNRLSENISREIESAL